jgi:hypothetical protein
MIPPPGKQTTPACTEVSVHSPPSPVCPGCGLRARLLPKWPPASCEIPSTQQPEPLILSMSTVWVLWSCYHVSSRCRECRPGVQALCLTHFLLQYQSRPLQRWRDPCSIPPDAGVVRSLRGPLNCKTEATVPTQSFRL